MVSFGDCLPPEKSYNFLLNPNSRKPYPTFMHHKKSFSQSASIAFIIAQMSLFVHVL